MYNNKALRLAAATFALSVLVAGCSADPGDEQAPPDGLQEATITRTIVHLNPDGTETREQFKITREQQIADFARLRQFDELRARGAVGTEESVGTSAQAITRDYSCFGSSLAMWAGTNQSGDEMCFYGSGTTTAVFTVGTWPNIYFIGPRSYYSGVDPGRFLSTTTPSCGALADTQMCTAFYEYEQYNLASTCERNSWYLDLGFTTSCYNPTLARSVSGYPDLEEVRGSFFRPSSYATVRWYRGNGTGGPLVKTDSVAVDGTGHFLAAGLQPHGATMTRFFAGSWGHPLLQAQGATREGA